MIIPGFSSVTGLLFRVIWVFGVNSEIIIAGSRLLFLGAPASCRQARPAARAPLGEFVQAPRFRFTIHDSRLFLQITLISNLLNNRNPNIYSKLIYVVSAFWFSLKNERSPGRDRLKKKKLRFQCSFFTFLVICDIYEISGTFLVQVVHWHTLAHVPIQYRTGKDYLLAFFLAIHLSTFFSRISSGSAPESSTTS
jgi:hypothetical protein